MIDLICLGKMFDEGVVGTAEVELFGDLPLSTWADNSLSSANNVYGETSIKLYQGPSSYHGCRVDPTDYMDASTYYLTVFDVIDRSSASVTLNSRGNFIGDNFVVSTLDETRDTSTTTAYTNMYLYVDGGTEDVDWVEFSVRFFKVSDLPDPSNPLTSALPTESAESNMPPVLTWFGNSEITVTEGNTYTPSAVIATDAEDGDITANIITTWCSDTLGTPIVGMTGIDASTATGTYYEHCTITDSDGASATGYRTVTVEEATAPPTGSTLVTTQSIDTQVIPDSFNTGLTDESVLASANSFGTYDGVPFTAASGDTIMAINGYSYSSGDHDLVVEDCDFSGYYDDIVENGEVSLQLTNPSAVTGSLRVTFRNCKMNGFTAPRDEGNTELVFENCEIIKGIANSGFTARNCEFKGSFRDALNPIKNVLVENCFIHGRSVLTDSENYHTDGCQIYGYPGIDIENVVLRNVRMDMPQVVVDGQGSGTYISSCISTSPEFSDAISITIEHCLFNGGGYTIYCADHGGQYTHYNTQYIDVKLGCSHHYGDIYTPVGTDENEQPVNMDGVSYADKLFVSSVEHVGDGTTRVVVTNYTSTARDAILVTDQGTVTQNIAKCYEYDELVSGITDDDFPSDIEIILPYEAQYVVGYDTSKTEANQIRREDFGVTQDIYVILD